MQKYSNRVCNEYVSHTVLFLYYHRFTHDLFFKDFKCVDTFTIYLSTHLFVYTFICLQIF